MREKELTEPGEFLMVPVARLATTMSKVDDPSLVGIRDLVMDIQAQRRQGESMADKSTRLASVMSQTKGRNAKRAAEKDRLDALRKEAAQRDSHTTRSAGTSTSGRGASRTRMPASFLISPQSVGRAQATSRVRTAHRHLRRPASYPWEETFPIYGLGS